ncbi:general substrate transporter [Halteromyces radiatus]|uniref:general substrate transporter n=1 Tax=Halteromyces radiatus TaxID=101107 RepID=UPI002220727E|nr:general substrate transporter [Halteromyces radiatus]KAI8097542.1 general substrate transporter [Halteromyces radiatus]
MYRIHRHFKGKDLVLAINLAAGLSIFFFGYDQGVMGSVNLSDDYLDIMGLRYNAALLGGVVSLYYVGTLIGALMGGWIGDKIGRVRTVVVGCCFAILGAALQTSAQNLYWMIFTRILTGVGTGHLNAVVPVWSAETSHHTSRGQMISMEFTLNIFGVVIAYWIGYGLRSYEGGIRWRFPIGFQLIPLVILAVGINFFPESPRWLLKQGRQKEALEIIAALRGDGDPNHPAAQKEYNDIIENIAMEREEGGDELGYISMLINYDKLNIPRRVHLSIWLQIVQELVGIGMITVYAPKVFQVAGFSESTSQLLSGLNNVSYMLSTLVAVFTLDKWGRRFTLYYGAVGQCLSLLLIGILVKPEIMEQNPMGYGIGATVFTFIYTAFFGMTWLTVPWLYPTEIFPTKVRAKGGAWSVVGWSVGNALVMEITPPMIQNIGWVTFLVFAAFNVLSIPFVYVFYPETANRTLEELDIVFTSKSCLVWKANKELALRQAETIDEKEEIKVEPSNNQEEEEQGHWK